MERSLRLCVESVWTSGQLRSLERFFGHSVDPERGKPTNREFIAMLEEEDRKRGVTVTTMSQEESAKSVEPAPVRKQEIVRSAEKNVHRINSCIYYIEEDFAIVQVDDQFEKLTGYSKEEALSGRINHMSLIFEEDKKEYLEYVLPENGRGEDLYLEHRKLDSD